MASGSKGNHTIPRYTIALVVFGGCFGALPMATGEEPVVVLEGHKGAAYCVAFSPDGKTVATGGTDALIRIWDVESGKQKFTLEATPPGPDGPTRGTFAVAFTPDGKTLLASIRWCKGPVDQLGFGEDITGGVRAWDLESKKLLYTISAAWAPYMALSPDGKTIATSSCSPRDRDIALWDVQTGKAAGSLGDRDTPAGPITFSPDSKQLAVGTPAGIVELWDVPAQKLLVAFRAYSDKNRVDDLAYAPDGKTLAVSAKAGFASLELFAVEDPDAVKLRDASEYGSKHNGRGCLRYTPDGKRLLSAQDNVAVYVLSSSTGALKDSIDCSAPKGIECIALSPDGKLLATAGSDGKVKIWKLAGN